MRCACPNALHAAIMSQIQTFQRKRFNKNTSIHALGMFRVTHKTDHYAIVQKSAGEKL